MFNPLGLFPYIFLGVILFGIIYFAVYFAVRKAWHEEKEDKKL